MNGLVFGIMSAVHRPETVAQLCRTLAPHRVVIHHDFGQQASFSIDMPHVEFVPDPRPTGWESFAFTEGIMRLLDHCLRDPSLRYFQLLSPTCLPIRPIGEFAEHVFADSQRVSQVADIDGIDILASHQALMNFGYRVFAPADSLRLRALFKASTWYFGANAPETIQAGLSIRIADDSARGVTSMVAECLMKAAQMGLLGRHPFGPDYRPYMGSAWFGAGKDAARYLLDHLQGAQEMAYFRRLAFPDEVVLSTILHNSEMLTRAANHLLKAFDGSRPRTLGLADVDNLRPGSKYFARKFADDPADPARVTLLQSLGQG